MLTHLRPIKYIYTYLPTERPLYNRAYIYTENSPFVMIKQTEKARSTICLIATESIATVTVNVSIKKNRLWVMLCSVASISDMCMYDFLTRIYFLRSQTIGPDSNQL